MSQLGEAIKTILSQVLLDSQAVHDDETGYDLQKCAESIGASGLVRMLLTTHDTFSEEERQEIKTLLTNIRESIWIPHITIFDSQRADEYEKVLDSIVALGSKEDSLV